MDEIMKKPYKISLWEDEQIYLVVDMDEDGNYDITKRYETTLLPQPNQKILNKYVKENCLANIGSNTMNTPIRAFEPKLTRQINGTNTLTFKVFYRYFDEDDEVFKTNPFISLLVNERKVKLFYDDVWYDFVIKQIQENSQTYSFTYTCQDLYLSELSKNGYELIFDTELLNNMGTVTELGETIVEGTDWRIDKDKSDFLSQKNDEALYTYQTPNRGLKATVLEKFEYRLEPIREEGEEQVIPPESIIFIGYSFYTEGGKEGDKIQFFWRADGRYETDDDGNIINSPIYEMVAPAELWSDETSLRITSDYRGRTLVESKRVYYVPEIERYCYNYKRNGTNDDGTDGKEYYAYMGSEFASFDKAENLIANATKFITTDGWTDVILSTVGEEVNGINTLTPALLADFSTTSEIQNNGLHASKMILQDYEGFTVGDKYLFAIKTDNNGITGARAILTSTKSTEKAEGEEIFNCKKLEIDDGRLNDYEVFELSVIKSFSYADVAQSYIYFYVQGTGQVNIIDAKLFKKIYRKVNVDGVIQKTLVIPDLETVIESAIEDKYFFFDKSQLTGDKLITSVDDITYSTICLEDEIEDNEYIFADAKSYEKVTNITASKSNRFNLIQELCEAFECWAKFEIEHNFDGRVIETYTISQDTKEVKGKKYYSKIVEDAKGNADYQYANFSEGVVYEKHKNKFIYFKEYVGIENFVGFRYGVNLNSITRELDSKQIVTKLIVEPNSNEYAPNGFCTIQNAIKNPTGEAVVYNFKYYLNNGLLNKDELITDLYDEVNGIGFYTGLSKANRDNAPYIEKLTQVSNCYTKAVARTQIYKVIIEEAKAKKAIYIEDLRDALTESGVENKTAETIIADEEEYNSVINGLIRQRDAMDNTINRYEPQLENIEGLALQYEQEMKNIESILAVNEEITKELNQEFFNKYSRYIQEGTWISEDFVDPNLYYLEAVAVGNTSAFPQVQYTINVIDVSGNQDYSNYRFNIGDKTYIEDTEFFGYVQETGRPYQEEVVITEMIYSLDNPEDNVIKVKNYKTQFEDLFQRVAAATQTLQYAEGKYARASDAIQEDGTIDGSILERTLNFNYCLADAITKEISEGGEVITLQAVTDPNRIVKISGLGIELSNTGGRDWRTAISADGINADVGVFGSLHTNNLRIYNGDDESFFWDANGITAYNWNNGNGTIYNQFVRMSKDGIFGYIGNQANRYNPVSDQEIMDNSVFALTWKGLSLQSLNNGKYVKLSTVGESTGYYNVKLTTDKYNSNTTYYSFNNGNYVEAEKTEENFIFDEKNNIIGFNPTATLYKKDSSSDGLKKIIWAGAENGDNFIVYEDGSIFAKNGYFEGDIYANNGYFKGEIEATGGTFKGIVNAEDLQINGVSILTAENKIDGDYLELLGLTIVDKNGKTILNIDDDGITFAPSAPIIQYQYSSNNINWHDKMQEGDIYRREKHMGDTAWRTGYQFIGTNAEEIEVDFDTILAALQEANDTETTFITATEVGAPNIYGGNIYGGTIYAGSGENASKTFSKMTGTGFEVYHTDVTKPKISLNSDADGTDINLALGSGNAAGTNTLVLSKTGTTAGLIYTTSKNEKRGIEFKNTGEVTIYGNMNAAAVAVFG